MLVPKHPTDAMLWAYINCPYEDGEDKWAAMLAAALPLPCKSGEGAGLGHEYGPSRVGHGEAQCIHCLATNRENAVIAPNVCSARAMTPAPDATQTREAELVAAISQALQCTPSISPAGYAEARIVYDCGDPWEILRAALNARGGA